MSLGQIASVYGILAAFITCASILEKRRRERAANKLQLKMVDWWYTLSENRIHQLPSLMANRFISFFYRLGEFKGFFIFKKLPILKYITISILLSSIMAVIGSLLDKRFLKYGATPFPHYSIYTVNFIFDFLTIFITMKLLGVVRRSKIIKGIGCILLDIVIASIFFLIVYVSISFTYQIWTTNRSPLFNTYYQNYNSALLQSLKKRHPSYPVTTDSEIYISFDLSFWDTVLVSANGVAVTLTGKPIEFEAKRMNIRVLNEHMDQTFHYKIRSYKSWMSVLLASTTLLPTFAYMLVLFIILCAKAAVELLMKILDMFSVGDKKRDFMPFTLSGITLTFLFSVYIALDQAFQLIGGV